MLFEILENDGILIIINKLDVISSLVLFIMILSLNQKFELYEKNKICKTIFIFTILIMIVTVIFNQKYLIDKLYMPCFTISMSIVFFFKTLNNSFYKKNNKNDKRY